MRLAIVAQPLDAVPPIRGGSIGIWTHELSKRLVGQHEITVYCRKTADRQEDGKMPHLEFQTFI